MKRLAELLAERAVLVVTRDENIAAADLRWLREQDLIGRFHERGAAIEIPSGICGSVSTSR